MRLGSLLGSRSVEAQGCLREAGEDRECGDPRDSGSLHSGFPCQLDGGQGASVGCRWGGSGPVLGE